MSGEAFCPHCGYDLAANGTVERGRFKYECSSMRILFDGQPANFTRRQAELLGTFLAANGAVVSAEVLSNRMGIDDSCLKVHLSHIRRKLEALGFPNAIANDWGRGYSWRVSA